MPLQCRSSCRKKLYFAVSTSLLATLSSSISYFTVTAQAATTSQKAITTENVNLREGSGIEYSVSNVLAPGTALEILNKNENNWYQVQVNGQLGWVNGDYVSTENRQSFSRYTTLDLRSASSVTASKIDHFIQSRNNNSPLIGTGKYFIDAQRKYGVNALYLAAHAILESGYGTSDIAVNKNNLFGYTAYDTDPYSSATTFASLADCIDHQASFVSSQYLHPDGDWYEGFPSLEGMNIHYATDPYWCEKVASIMQEINDL